MKRSLEVINGNNSKQIHDSKLEIVESFYKAFNNKDIDLMNDNWSHSESIVMANPIGGIRYGWEEILNGYRKIFSSNHKVYVELYDFQIFSSDQMFVINGRERGHLVSGNCQIDLKIRTTRIYQLEGVRWRQIIHHGSIDEPKLLEKYQNIILNK